MNRIAILPLLALAAAGCGANEAGPTTLGQTTNTGAAARATQVLQLEAAPNGALRFNVKVLKATSTKVQLVMTNSSNVAHDIALRGHGVHEVGDVVTGPETPSTVTATVKPGRYEFYCSVDGHEAAGMKGTLVVGAPA